MGIFLFLYMGSITLIFFTLFQYFVDPMSSGQRILTSFFFSVTLCGCDTFYFFNSTSHSFSIYFSILSIVDVLYQVQQVWCNKNSPCVQVTKESIHTPGLDKGLATFKPTSHSTSGTIEDPTRNATNGADGTRRFSSSACSRYCCDTLGMRKCGNGC